MSLVLIAHRGNTNGSNSSSENEPSHVVGALQRGFDVEIDVRLIQGQWFLGHDFPQYPVKFDFLKKNGLWCHAKNLEALKGMLEEDIHCFWHQNDDYTLTSRGYIWAYPNKQVGKKTICLMPEQTGQNPAGGYGVCSDFVERYYQR